MAQTTIQGGFLAADLVSAQTALSSGLATTDEIIVSDAGVIKRMDISVWSDSTETFTNKTLTAPIINAGTLNLMTVLTVANDIDVGAYEVRALKFESDQATGTAPLTVASTTVVTNLNADLLDGVQGALYSQIVAAETLTNKTLTSPVLNTGVSGSAVLDSDAMSGVSATTLASSESIKAYVDTTATIADDSIVEAKLDVSNNPTNGQFLQAQSGGGGLTWAAASSSLTSAIQSHVDGGTYKCIALLECAYARAAFAESGNQSETNHLGMGWDVTVGSSNGTAAPSTVIRGGWAFTTHALANNTAGIETKNILDPADDWTIGCRVRIVAHADVQFFMGIAVNAGIAKRATTNAIGITALGTNGNFILFVDSGGSEGTDDSGVAHGGTEHALRMEIRSGGSTVEYFVDNTSYGSIASGLPTNTDMNINIGMNSGGSTAITCHISDAYAYREI